MTIRSLRHRNPCDAFFRPPAKSDADCSCTVRRPAPRNCTDAIAHDERTLSARPTGPISRTPIVYPPRSVGI